jgi:hypothetical protein
MRQIPSGLLLLLLLFVPLPSGSEMLGPGAYHGYVRQDRWGQKVLQQGPYTLFLSDPAFEELRSKIGQPLAVRVSRVDSRIEEISSADLQSLEHGVELELRADRAQVTAGQGIVLTVIVRNASDSKLRWPVESLWLVFTRSSSPYAEEERAGKTLWPYRSGYLRLFQNLGFLAACEVPLKWDDTELRSNDRCDPKRIPLGWVVEQETIVGTDLSPGEYEVFVYWKNGNFSYTSGAMSNTVDFDVLEP